jgi:hypothetical protein
MPKTLDTLVNFTLQQHTDLLRSLQLYADTLWRVVSAPQLYNSTLHHSAFSPLLYGYPTAIARPLHNR